MTNRIILIVFLIAVTYTNAQTLTGKIIDAKTKTPLETVSVYFDNTTIGTTTNDSGEFSIDYTDAVQSVLVISYLGYEKVLISDYRTKAIISIELKEAVNELDAVIINANDGMPREQKLRWFRKEFLGKSENAKSCKILNEKDIKLKFNKQDRTITAWSKTPVLVRNKNLKYDISFDIIDFEITLGNWSASSVIYTGTSFYKDLNLKKKEKVLKRRTKTYKGSVQHFMRALYNKTLKEEGYVIFNEGFKVNEWDYINIKPLENSDYKSVTIKNSISILFDEFHQSDLILRVSQFAVDVYGNYTPIEGVLFNGVMGDQRLADSLPLDYGLAD
jgi:hypothetical protein